MADIETNSNISALDALLDDERTALLEGDLEKLTQMLVPKETLIAALNAESQTDLPAIKSLDAKVRRNQLLLDGALEGIRSVSQKMAKLRKMRATLDTYDATGRKNTIEAESEASVERRA